LKKHRFSAVFFHLPPEKHRFLRFFGVFIRWSNFWVILPFTLGKSGFFAVFSHFWADCRRCLRLGGFWCRWVGVVAPCNEMVAVADTLNFALKMAINMGKT